MEGTLWCASRSHLTGVAVAALALTTLAACGSDDDGSSTDDDGGAESADIRVWLNGTDTPQEARDWLKKTFEDDNPGSTLTIEQQEWDGLVEKLTTALSSESETPDVVEIGNTQAPTFTSAGAFSPLTDELDDLGGDDLLPGLRRGCDGRRRDVRRAVLRRLEVHLLPQGPLREVRHRGAHDARRVRRGGRHAEEGQPQAGQLLRLLVPRVRTGATARPSCGPPAATSPSRTAASGPARCPRPSRVAGLEMAQQLFTEASGAPKDGNEADPWTPFCAGEVGMMSTPGWVKGLLEDPETGCPDGHAKQVGVFALPGPDGEPAPGAARRLRHRHRGQVGQPGPRPGGGRAHAQRGLPDADGRGRPHACPHVARPAARRRRVRRGDRGRGVQRQAHAGRSGLGQRSRAHGSWRTSSAPSPRAATWRSSQRRPTSR